MDAYLSEIYYKPEHPASYGSVEKLYRQSVKDAKSYTRDDIREWLRKQESYTRHYPARRRYRRSRVMTYGLNYLWQADLVDVQKLARYNKRNRYILTAIDTFSKKAWAIPVKRKTATNLKSAFTELFNTTGLTPKYIHLDQGSEFWNKDVKALFKTKNIKFYSTASELKASIIERFNRTLRNRMFKYFTAKNTLNYISVLDKLIEGYNAAVHRSIGLAPNAVNQDNSSMVFKKLYPKLDGKEKPLFVVGDQVRISFYKRPVFDKGYTPNYSLEIFTVAKVYDNIPPTYKLKEYNGSDVEGIFYNEELIKVIVPGDSLFKVEKILKTRKRKGHLKEYFIKWLGYDDSYNSWTTSVQHV